jgi:hypothetical protein
LGAITFALTLTETLQYVSFSAARNYFAGDLTIQDQTDAATAKASTLLTKLPFLAGARNSGWIEIKKTTADNFSDQGNGYESTLGGEPDPKLGVSRRDQFTGFQIAFELPILNINIPLLGNFASPSGEDSFHGTVSSFLMREPSTDECMKYIQGIYNVLQQKFPTAPPGTFTAIVDNGC